MRVILTSVVTDLFQVNKSIVCVVNPTVLNYSPDDPVLIGLTTTSRGDPADRGRSHTEADGHGADEPHHFLVAGEQRRLATVNWGSHEYRLVE